MHKPAVREIARRAGLDVADKPDSQDLCFLAGVGRERFLERHGALGRRPGAVLDLDGRAIGDHDGAHRFTVGQRRGLGIGGGTPLYVVATDTGANTVTVGPRAALAARTVVLRDAVLHGRAADHVRLRHRQRPVRCMVASRGNDVVLTLLEPVAGVAPGQLACLMKGDSIVGHGTIDSAGRVAPPPPAAAR
jgi:tRNA-specific 2-thiouridylase